MQWEKQKQGFTIVELLIVVVVIAILAAITIVAYNGIQNRAKQSAAAQLLSQVQKKIGIWRVENAETLPGSLSQVTGLPTTSTVEYRRFDNNTQYCVSTISNGVSYYANSTQPSQYQAGTCSDVTSIPGAGEPLAHATPTNSTATLSTPISGITDITLYGVFDVINTSSGWEAIAQLRPSAAPNVFQLDMSGAGSDAARYRLDTSASTNTSASKAGVRTPGRHIGWMQVSAGATVRSFNYDAAASFNTASFAPGTGWNFTSLYAGTTAAGTNGVAALVYVSAHDEATRARVMQWLATTYSVPATY